MMRRVRKFIGLAAVAALVLAPQMASAQSNVTTGQIFGTVSDPGGAVLPGVTVEVSNVDTGLDRRAVTDDAGRFRFDLLPSGNYEIKAELEGFKTEIKRGINVTLGSSVRLDFDLQLSAVEEEIVVTAEAPVVETTNPSVTSSVSDQAIANLPLVGRDFTDFIQLTPASVSSNREDEVAEGRGGVNIGARAIQNSFNIDGSGSQSSFFGEERGGTRPPFTFSQAAIKEFQVIKSSYTLQFNASGGVINAITKSGTNDFHGEVFTYYRDDGFVEEDALGRDAEAFEQQQYGFAVGGPLIRDQLHFFVSYDGQDFTNPYFAEFVDFPEARTADWEALTGLNYSTEVGEIPQTNDAQVLMVKLDWQLSDNHLLSIRDNWSDQEGEHLTSRYSNTGLSNNGLEENSFNSFVANLSSLVSDSSFNELIFQYAKEERPRSPNVTSIPEVGIYRYRAAFGQNNFLPNWLDEDRVQVIDNFTYYLGDHTLKGGFSVDMVEFDDGFCRYCSGSYSYDEWEDSFAGANDGFLDGGLPYSYTQAFSDYDGAVVFNTDYWGLYLQDEWRANPNLTVTYGLRYDVQKHDSPKETNPLYPDTGQIPDDDDNFAPRVGFAWDVGGDGKAVLRGGFGYFYDNSPTLLDANAMLANGVRVQRFTCYPDPAEGVVCPTFPNVWNDISEVEGSLYSDIFVFDPNFQNPETWRASIGYEREIMTDFSVGFDVIYAESRHLERKQDRNLVPDGGYTVYGAPTYDRNANYPQLGKIMTFVSDARQRYKALVIKARKRYSNGWFFDGSYTLSESRDQDSNERSVSSSSGYPEDHYNLAAEWGPSNFDVKHKIVMSMSYELPWDMLISGIIYIRSGFPYTAYHDGDLNGDGFYNDRGTILRGDEYYHYPRNSFRQPWFSSTDLRLSKAIRFGDDYELEIIAEVFNLFDRKNQWTTRFDRTEFDDGEYIAVDDFGQLNQVGTPRQYQLGVKFHF
jgi:hypothetical protein